MNRTASRRVENDNLTDRSFAQRPWGSAANCSARQLPIDTASGSTPSCNSSSGDNYGAVSPALGLQLVASSSRSGNASRAERVSGRSTEQRIRISVERIFAALLATYQHVRLLGVQGAPKSAIPFYSLYICCHKPAV